MDAFSLKNSYLKCLGEQLRDAVNDQGCLGIIHRGLTKFIMVKYGGCTALTEIMTTSCLHFPTTRTIVLPKENGIQIGSFEKSFYTACITLENK
jgi:hypothetical protein